MADVVQDNSRKYYSPSSKVSIDEMMVRFGGRSKDRYRIQGNPISEGYKIFALCDSGFTYSFLFASSREKTLLEEDFTGEQLNETQKEVLTLSRTLPKGHFDIYMDNYFTSVKLFSKLRSEGIGACGTVRASSGNFPPSLRGVRDQRGLRAEWGKLGGVVVNDVMVAAWVDNNIVYMLSTIHTIHKPADHVEVPRKRPRENSNNSATRNDLFGENAVLPLKIPKIIYDYNHNMNDVDIADQMRSNYATQRTHYKTWVPLFYCCLDTAIVNAYMILKLAKPTFEHKDFLLSIAAALFKKADEYDSEPDDKPERQRVVVKAGTKLPPGRLHGSHIVRYNDMSRRECFLCRWLSCNTPGEKSK
ncbi:hypothetical protein MP638_005583 [Amoeboaphelidium occidentale]|nr:hypothetical protein MP638_005583 [Amoeboaphelidium occidentale]